MDDSTGSRRAGSTSASDEHAVRPLPELYADHVERAIAFAGADAAFFTELKAADLVALAARRVGSRAEICVLDFGCGTGALDALSAPDLRAVTGIDSSSGLLEVAAAENPYVEYRQIEPGERLADVSELTCVVRPWAASL